MRKKGKGEGEVRRREWRERNWKAGAKTVSRIGPYINVYA
jgi:hypothetical protein